ncbi:MAG: ComF family protein [Planctomycetota bacterium]
MYETAEKKLLASFRQKLISFVYRPSCCFCEQPFNPDGNAHDNAQPLVCMTCHENIFGNAMDHCYTCGALSHPLNPFVSRCSACRYWSPKFQRAFAIGNYQSTLRETILDMKRKSDDIRCFQLGQVIGQVIEKFDLEDEIDHAIPVPTHWQRRIGRRGLHIAGVISEGFSRMTRVPIVTNALKCIRPTKKQSKLRPNQRIKNVRGAFECKSKALRETNVLLIDDVMTSGATINECARVLSSAGVKNVYVAVAARGTGIG